MIKPLAGLALLLPQAALAQEFSTTRYLCDRDIALPATYVNGPDLALVVIQVDGQQVTLLAEPAASGARYAWPSDGSGYVWWTKDNAATLYWKTPEGEAPILTCLQG